MTKFKLEFSLTGEAIIEIPENNPKDVAIKKQLIETLKNSGIEIGDLKLSLDYKEPIEEEYDNEKTLDITDQDREKLEGLYYSVANLAEDVFEKDDSSKDLTNFSTEIIGNDGRLGFHDENHNADEEFAIWIEPSKVEEDIYEFTLYIVDAYENLNKTRKPKSFGIVTGHINQIEDVLARKFLEC